MENSEFEKLPNEMIYEIIEHLRGADLLRFCMTCKRIYQIINDKDYWKRRWEKDYKYYYVSTNIKTDNIEDYFKEYIFCYNRGILPLKEFWKKR